MKNFEIEFLDHVAIKVKDLNTSTEWYERVLGLRKLSLPEWKDYPVMMLAGKTGIAIFPAKENEQDGQSPKIRIDHFAFNVSNTDFEKARQYFNSIGEVYEFQDHFYFHSIYLKDPDGHKVELTTLVASDDLMI